MGGRDQRQRAGGPAPAGPAGRGLKAATSGLAEEGIAVRTGHHCEQPIPWRFGVETTVRPSLAFYKTHEEIDRLGGVVQRMASVRRARLPGSR
ncbi:MAG: aminotransferase class V-fold PLP-dependent enzyme [Ottowia sp.]|jgi:hypothetical protein|nr:aminotransferase class V-fold PLP-dependent enzyme [Ottowia sp.]MBK6748241.1 aminotransferase class V-fold PLP-dependent enzyme [Ottowia sp.]